ncbi:MAG: DUF4870 domain-containing protein [Acidobacteria bacterium]|nr:DUF4870 domain-containing protein [Acidobacteriota bacterium]
MSNTPPSGPGRWSAPQSEGGNPTGGPPWGEPPGGPPQKTKFAGLAPHVAAMICYLPICFNLVVAIIFFVTEKELRFVRFHAAQSLTLFGAYVLVNVGLALIGGIPGLGFLTNTVIRPVFGLACFVLYIFLAMKAYNNEWYKIPTVGDVAERLANQ